MWLESDNRDIYISKYLSGSFKSDFVMLQYFLLTMKIPLIKIYITYIFKKNTFHINVFAARHL